MGRIHARCFRTKPVQGSKAEGRWCRLATTMETTLGVSEPAKADLLDRPWGAVLLVHALLIAGTGVGLSFLYQPAGTETSSAFVEVLSTVHQWLAWLFVPLVIGVGIAMFARQRRLQAVSAVVTLLVALVTIFLGARLAWDNLAFASVRPGTGVSGHWILFDSDVLFAIVDGMEVTRGTLLGFFAAHILGAAVVVVSALPLARRKVD